MRLNKFISSCGIAARRKAETLILSGRIQVNGKIVLAPFYEVDPRNDIVTFDHKELQLIEKVYYVIACLFFRSGFSYIYFFYSITEIIPTPKSFAVKPHKIIILINIETGSCQLDG